MNQCKHILTRENRSKRQKSSLQYYTVFDFGNVLVGFLVPKNIVNAIQQKLNVFV